MEKVIAILIILLLWGCGVPSEVFQENSAIEITWTNGDVDTIKNLSYYVNWTTGLEIKFENGKELFINADSYRYFNIIVCEIKIDTTKGR